MPCTTSLSWPGYPCKAASIGLVNKMPATQHGRRQLQIFVLLYNIWRRSVSKNKMNRHILRPRRHRIENHPPHACMRFEASFPKLHETPKFARRWLPICLALTFLCLFVELIQQLLNLPQRIYLLLFTWAVTVVGYSKVLKEVLPATSRFDSLACRRVLLPEGGADEVTTKQWLLVLGEKPEIELWLWVEAICKSTPNILYISVLSKEMKSMYSPLPTQFP